ncbi:TPA: hypothetical protein G9F10_004036 [Salmonella enterica]|nr:hypothetical protein [Salmonella enterica]
MDIPDDIQPFVFRDDTRPDKQPVVESMSESRSGADVSENLQDARQPPGYPEKGDLFVGCSDAQTSLLLALIDTPSGMRITAGPTGSGQSTPLRTSCRTLITEDGYGHS